jgi:DNA-directed RNA polymerase subunit beta
MGANMQRQSIPLINPYAPVIGTGSEYKIAHDSGMAVVSEVDGEVIYSDSTKVIVRDKDNVDHESKLIKYVKTNQSTCNNQKTIVRVGEQVKKDDIIADGPAMKSGELALGQNVIVAFTT